MIMSQLLGCGRNPSKNCIHLNYKTNKKGKKKKKHFKMSLNKIIHQVVSQEGRFTITTIFPLCVCVWWVGGGEQRREYKDGI